VVGSHETWLSGAALRQGISMTMNVAVSQVGFGRVMVGCFTLDVRQLEMEQFYQVQRSVEKGDSPDSCQPCFAVTVARRCGIGNLRKSHVFTLVFWTQDFLDA